jgi:hypothetical protein
MYIWGGGGGGKNEIKAMKSAICHKKKYFKIYN